MAVLNDTLLKEFAKATNDTEKEIKTESYVYGTAHVSNGTIQVQFDGSDLLTPCSATVEVKDGDRVMVMIKNRSAVITSNITTPSIHYTIGGLDISEDAIKWNGSFDNKDYEVGLYKNQGHQGDKFVAMNVGGKYVTYTTYDGYLHSENAYIEGELHADRGEFTGEVSFAGGYIGGLRITSDSIYWEDTIQGVKYTSGIYKGTNSAADKFWCVKNTTKDLAYLRYDGYLYAENAYIKGEIHAGSGEINGTLKITGGTIGGLNIDGNSVSWTNMIEGTNYKAGIYKGTAKTSYFLDINAGGNHRTYLRYDGYFYAENAAIQGKITATEGAIGGFDIGTTSITWTNTINNVKYVCGLYKGNNATTDKFLRITRGGTDVAYMQYDGKLYATSVDVKGKLSTEAGSAIGGMATDNNKIGWSSGNNCGYIRKYTSSSTKFIDVQVNGVDTTYLTYGGKFYSQNAEITGDIIANTLTARDNFYMEGTTVFGNYGSTTTKLQALGYSYQPGAGGVLFIGNDFDIVSIGQQNDTSKNIHVFGYVMYVHGNLKVEGSIEDHASSSDIRLKTNVKNTETKALPVINAIPMRQFDWKEDKSHQVLGMVADEIELLDSRLVNGGGYYKDGTMHTKTINTLYLCGYLTKAVQELSSKVEELERRLENGESK